MALTVKSVEKAGKHNVVTIGDGPPLTGAEINALKPGFEVPKAGWDTGGWKAGEPVVIGVDYASGPDKTVIGHVPPTGVLTPVKPDMAIKADTKSFVQAMAGVTGAFQAFSKSLGGEVEVEADAQSIAQAKPQLGQTEVQALVYEMAVIERKIIEMDTKELLKRKEELRKALLDHVDPNAPLNMTVEFTDAEGNVVQFSAAPEQQVLVEDQKPALIAAIGSEQFMALAKITITDLKKVLSGNELKKFCTIKPGTRVMKVMPK